MRITIPNTIRERYGFQIGAIFEIIDNEGEIILRPVVRKSAKIRVGQKWGGSLSKSWNHDFQE